MRKGVCTWNLLKDAWVYSRPLTHPHESPTQACALTGNWTSDPLLCRTVLNPLSHTSQGILTIFKCRVQFNSIKYPHVVGLPSPPSTSRTFFFFYNWNMILVTQLLPIPPTSQLLATTILLLSVSTNLGTLSTSSEWNPTLFVSVFFSFCDGLISFSMRSSSFIHGVACVQISFPYNME